jgi:hypothetical protein
MAHALVLDVPGDATQAASPAEQSTMPKQYVRHDSLKTRQYRPAPAWVWHPLSVSRETSAASARLTSTSMTKDGRCLEHVALILVPYLGFKYSQDQNIWHV